MFELDPRLKTFVAAAETGSFAQAAERVFVSSTAVMKQINQLEDAVGVALFRRSHQGLTLTPAGESFLADVRQLQKDAQSAVTRARAAGGDAGTIRIGTSPMTPARVLIDLWPKVHAIAPNLRFSLVPFENTPANARANLTGMGRDMDMVAGFVDEGLLKTHGCAGLALYRTPLCVAVPLDHPLAGKKSLVPRDLYGETLLIVKRVTCRRWMPCAKTWRLTIRRFAWRTSLFTRRRSSTSARMAANCWSPSRNGRTSTP